MPSYELGGTDLRYGATGQWERAGSVRLYWLLVRPPRTLPDLAYAATLSSCMALLSSYWPSVWCTLYRAMRCPVLRCYTSRVLA
eukprot:1767029-Rhodomonas_salina.1